MKRHKGGGDKTWGKNPLREKMRERQRTKNEGFKPAVSERVGEGDAERGEDQESDESRTHDGRDLDGMKGRMPP